MDIKSVSETAVSKLSSYFNDLSVGGIEHTYGGMFGKEVSVFGKNLRIGGSNKKTILFMTEEDGSFVLNDALEKKNYIELDATTSFTVNMSNSVNKRPVENRDVYIEGVLRQPITIKIEATIASNNTEAKSGGTVTKGKIEQLEKIFEEKIALKIFGYKELPGIFTRRSFTTLPNDFFVTNLVIRNVASDNTVNITLELMEIRTYSIYSTNKFRKNENPTATKKTLAQKVDEASDSTTVPTISQLLLKSKYVQYVKDAFSGTFQGE